MGGLDTVVGVPFDCTGRFAGCERLPAALRAAGLVGRLGFRDGGNLQVVIADPGAYWLHLDLDVLDEKALPAVNHPQLGGLDWDGLTDLVRPLASSPAVLGADVTIPNPTLDGDGRCVARAADLLVELFADSTPGTGGHAATSRAKERN